MAATYYKAVGGITDGMAYHGSGEVFVGSEALDQHFEDTEGKQGDVLLYEKVDRAAYVEYLDGLDHSLVDGSPRNVVGFEPTGEDSLVAEQKAGVEPDADPLKADEQAGKPEDGEPIPFDSAEAERRADAPADEDAVATVPTAEGSDGGGAVAPSVKKASGTSTTS